MTTPRCVNRSSRSVPIRPWGWFCQVLAEPQDSGDVRVPRRPVLVCQDTERGGSAYYKQQRPQRPDLKNRVGLTGCQVLAPTYSCQVHLTVSQVDAVPGVASV